MKNKLTTTLLVWSAIGTSSLVSSLIHDKAQFEQSFQYAFFSAQQWLPTDVKIGQNGWWTAELAQFNADVYHGHNDAVFFVQPWEEQRLINLCKQNNIAVRHTNQNQAPIQPAAIAVIPGLLAAWLLWRRREKKMRVQNLGCGKQHGEQRQQQKEPAKLTAEAHEVRKAKAMARVHVISTHAEAREFIKRL